ncbi:MAG: hypothetical protein HZA02_10315 [Nitrospinae bacterium]|nr:hypothetical protein [Nitrospinota bacterium]
MLLFAKDITKRNHVHSLEDRDPGLKEYMEYQRRLFPYTIARAGLDLAYKELDDILRYADNGFRPPADSNRQDYPADVDAWYAGRFPWTASFLGMEDTHCLLVVSIKAMDSFRTQETPNACHWTVLYDAARNIVSVYNELLRTSPQGARDINLSKGVEVNFDDFINNYWPALDFMLLSRPDYPHARLMERNRRIELAVRERMGEGDPPLHALEKVAGEFGVDESALALLGRNPLQSRFAELVPMPLDESRYAWLYREQDDPPGHGEISVIDREYALNFELTKNSHSSQTRRAAV